MTRLILLCLLFNSSHGLNIYAQTKLKQKKEIKTDWLTYQNPIINANLSDPYILFENGYSYIFTTGKAQDNRYIPIYRSEDLSDLEFVRGAVINGGKVDWNHKYFWAPEVIKIQNKFYLYYTASPEISPANSGNRVGVAVANRVEGPYENIGVVIPNESIGGHPVFDKDGIMYIFYINEWQQSKVFKAGQIYLAKTISPTQVADDPKPLITHHNWQEGAYILQRNNTYFLTYSCRARAVSTYRVRYAKSTAITGPYIEQRDTILKSNSMVKGPGRHSLFKDKNNFDWIVYQGWDTAYKARYHRIERIVIG